MPQVASVDDFELCRAIKEKGRPTGQYEPISEKDTVKQSVTNWERLFVQFKNEHGESAIAARNSGGHEHSTSHWGLCTSSVHVCNALGSVFHTPTLHHLICSCRKAAARQGIITGSGGRG